MDIYLPIAGLSVNALVIIGLGGLVGLLTGMVGVGGGFLTTPILIFYGIPPAVAVASATTQITGTSISGVLAHRRRRGVDIRMGVVIIVGGVFGSIVGGFVFRLLQQSGQIDTVISILYVLLLGMSAQVVVGTSLLQILFVTGVTTIVHATTTRSVDIVLAGLLLIGSVIGAQYGARFAQKMKPELLRMILAIMVLAVAARMALQLGWQPEEIYTVQML